MDELFELHRIEKIAERQLRVREALGRDDLDPSEAPIFDFGSVAPAVYERSCESLVGHVAIPVGVVGPLLVHYASYAEDDVGELVEAGESQARVPIPMATHEGGLNASLNRGIKAVNRCGGVSTHVLQSSMTRGSCYVFENADQALRFARWAQASQGAMSRWLEDPENPFRDAEMGGVRVLSRHARLRRLDAYPLSNTCHVVFRYSVGDACGQNMTTRNTYMLHANFILPRFHADTGIVPAHFFLEANTGGDKKSSHLYHLGGGHGRSVIASAILREEVLNEVLHCSVEEILKIREVGSEGAALSGMIGVSVNPVNVIAAVFAATGQDLACAGTSSMAMISASECPEGLHMSLRLPNLEVGSVGGGTGLPHQQRWLEMMGCAGTGGANRLAQVLGGAALSLEISTGAAMAAAGSRSFFVAHLERGGMKRSPQPARVEPRLVEELKREG